MNGRLGRSWTLRGVAAATIGAAMSVAVAAQAPPAAPAAGNQGAPPAGRGAGAQGRGGQQPGGRATFPAQQRQLADAAVIDRGKTLFTINCAACHGADARGGDQGGPNLLRSQVVLNDQHGELILPIVRGAREKMPPFPNIAENDVTAIAEFLHSLAAAGRGRGMTPLNILVGDQSAGQAAFSSMCASCHSVTGDLKGIATRIPDPLTLQNFWVGGGRSGRGGGPGGGAAPTAANPKPTTVTVTLASGQKVEGTLVRIDDFLVSLTDATGYTRTLVRDGDTPKVEVHDPLESHNQLLPKYTDKQIHDITAYLVTVK
jgi:cytochrome c oxidase cbb3-type subunit 3